METQAAVVTPEENRQALVVAKRKEVIAVNLGQIKVYVPNVPEIHLEIEKAIVEAHEVLGQAERALIETKEDYGGGGDIIKAIRGRAKTANEYRREIVDPINKFVKFFNSLFKEAEGVRNQATRILETKIQAYSDAQRAQERADEAARQRLIEEEALKRAEAATEAVDQDAILEVASEVVEEVIHKGPKSLARGYYGSTTSARQQVSGEVGNVRSLCQCIADGMIPDNMVTFSKAKLNTLAQKLHDEKKTMPGLEIIVQDKVVVR